MPACFFHVLRRSDEVAVAYLTHPYNIIFEEFLKSVDQNVDHGPLNAKEG